MLEVSRSVTKEPLRCWSTSTESPSKSSSEYGAPLTWNSSVSAIRPWAPTMPSDGLATMEGSGSKGRKPGLSSRVKQSCRLLKWVLRASDRSRSENSFHSAMEPSRTSGFSILENQPMKRVRAARGMRLVNRKLRSSCWVKEAMRALTVMNLSARRISACCHGNDTPDSFFVRGRRSFRCRRLHEDQGADRIVPRQAPLARRTLQDVAPGGKAASVLRIRRRCLLCLRRRAGERRNAAQGRLLPPRTPLRRALPQGPRDDEGSGGKDLRPALHRDLPRAVPVLASRSRAFGHFDLRGVLARRHRQGCRRQHLLRPYRLLWRQHLRQRLLQGVHRGLREAGARARTGTRTL